MELLKDCAHPDIIINNIIFSDFIKKSLVNFPSGAEQIHLALSIGFRKAEYKTLAIGKMGILLLTA